MRYSENLFVGLEKLVKRGPPRPALAKTRLILEALESRELLSASPMLVATPVTGAVPAVVATTDSTSLVGQLQASGKLAKPTGPTMLYLNFDGWFNTPYSGNIGSSDVGEFTGQEPDIQSILYQTAEVFAPFNVEVLQISGDGNYSTATGATTIFVGTFINGSRTPSQFDDYPQPATSTDHLFNTDKYDIAFVNQDIPGPTTSDVRDLQIVAAIAHEAGHTFGLSHVRTDGIADYPNNPFNGVPFSADLPPDVMSYDSNNDFFNNTTFNVTEANGSGTSPSLFPQYQNTYITMQNSFTYLQAVLGARPTTSQIDVVDEGTEVIADSQPRPLNLVDPGYYQNPNTPHQSVKPLSINTVSTVTGNLKRAGDYVAYQLNLVGTNWVPGDTLSVTPTSGVNVNLMVYDETPFSPEASTVVASSINSAPTEMFPEAGHVFYLVVGATYATAGSFTFTIGAVKTHLPGNTFTVRDAKQNVTGQVTLATVSGGQITGTFTPNDVSKVTVPVSGNIGALVNGTSAIHFTGFMSTSKTLESNQEELEIQTTAYLVKFAGQITHVAKGFSLSGTGSYTITLITTVTNPHTHRGTQGSKVKETLPIASGFALVQAGSPVGPIGGLPVSSTMIANQPAAPASFPVKSNVETLDALMAQAVPTKEIGASDLSDPFGDPVAE
jgi:hypothetical protein